MKFSAATLALMASSAFAHWFFLPPPPPSVDISYVKNIEIAVETLSSSQDVLIQNLQTLLLDKLDSDQDDTTQSIVDLKEQLASLDAYVRSIKVGDNSGLTAEQFQKIVDKLQEILTNQNNFLPKIFADIGQLNGKVDTVGTNVQHLGGDVHEVDTKVDAILDLLKQHKGAFETLQTAIGTYAAIPDQTDLASKVNALGGRVDEVNTKVDLLDTKVGDVDSKIVYLTSLIQGLSTSQPITADDLSTYFLGVNMRLEAVLNKQNDFYGYMYENTDNVEGDLGTIKSQLDSGIQNILQEIEKIKTHVDDNQSDIKHDITAFQQGLQGLISNTDGGIESMLSDLAEKSAAAVEAIKSKIVDATNITTGDIDAAVETLKNEISEKSKATQTDVQNASTKIQSLLGELLTKQSSFASSVKIAFETNSKAVGNLGQQSEDHTVTLGKLVEFANSQTSALGSISSAISALSTALQNNDPVPQLKPLLDTIDTTTKDISNDTKDISQDTKNILAYLQTLHEEISRLCEAQKTVSKDAQYVAQGTIDSQVATLASAAAENAKAQAAQFASLQDHLRDIEEQINTVKTENHAGIVETANQISRDIDSKVEELSNKMTSLLTEQDQNTSAAIRAASDLNSEQLKSLCKQLQSQGEATKKFFDRHNGEEKQVDTTDVFSNSTVVPTSLPVASPSKSAVVEIKGDVSAIAVETKPVKTESSIKPVESKPATTSAVKPVTVSPVTLTNATTTIFDGEVTVYVTECPLTSVDVNGSTHVDIVKSTVTDAVKKASNSVAVSKPTSVSTSSVKNDVPCTTEEIVTVYVTDCPVTSVDSNGSTTIETVKSTVTATITKILTLNTHTIVETPDLPSTTP
ncbi:hypothetical protein CKK34_1469 [Yarrowia sp. E02]|nr:hypothetical protein CKK34_1469 [Yarrowia sp. E02]